MYHCEVCDYSTENRSKIEYHHIIPKELGGCHKKFNRVYLCPTCHSHVYIPESKQGSHSLKSEKSIEIKGWLSSTGGRVLNYINSTGDEVFIISKN